MSEWISVEGPTPSQGVRVLLAIRDEYCPVVGYWGCGEYEVCTVNMICHGNDNIIEGDFASSDVTHWMPLPEPPK